MEYGYAGWNFENFITINQSFCLKISKSNKNADWNKGMQVGKFLKFNTCVGSNKGVQVGKFLKPNKVCCTIIWTTKVEGSQNWCG